MNNLPYELLLKTYGYLPWTEKLRLRRVSNSFNRSHDECEPIPIQGLKIHEITKGIRFIVQSLNDPVKVVELRRNKKNSQCSLSTQADCLSLEDVDIPKEDIPKKRTLMFYKTGNFGYLVRKQLVFFLKHFNPNCVDLINLNREAFECLVKVLRRFPNVVFKNLLVATRSYRRFPELDEFLEMINAPEIFSLSLPQRFVDPSRFLTCKLVQSTPSFHCKFYQNDYLETTHFYIPYPVAFDEVYFKGLLTRRVQIFNINCICLFRENFIIEYITNCLKGEYTIPQLRFNHQLDQGRIIHFLESKKATFYQENYCYIPISQEGEEDRLLWVWITEDTIQMTVQAVSASIV